MARVLCSACNISSDCAYSVSPAGVRRVGYELPEPGYAGARYEAIRGAALAELARTLARRLVAMTEDVP